MCDTARIRFHHVGAVQFEGGALGADAGLSGRLWRDDGWVDADIEGRTWRCVDDSAMPLRRLMGSGIVTWDVRGVRGVLGHVIVDCAYQRSSTGAGKATVVFFFMSSARNVCRLRSCRASRWAITVSKGWLCAAAARASAAQLAVYRSSAWGCLPVAWKMTRRAISTAWSANRS